MSRRGVIERAFDCVAGAGRFDRGRDSTRDQLDRTEVAILEASDDEAVLAPIRELHPPPDDRKRALG